MINNKQITAICPYFESCDERNTWATRYIRCSGVNKDTFIQLVFREKSVRDEYFKTHCEKYEYYKCPIADMFERMYGDEMDRKDKK